MSQKAIARELQDLLAEIQDRAQRAERVAESSRLVNPSTFRAIQAAVALSAGELDQRGLLDQPRAAAPVDAGAAS